MFDNDLLKLHARMTKLHDTFQLFRWHWSIEIPQPRLPARGVAFLYKCTFRPAQIWPCSCKLHHVAWRYRTCSSRNAWKLYQNCSWYDCIKSYWYMHILPMEAVYRRHLINCVFFVFAHTFLCCCGFCRCAKLLNLYIWRRSGWHVYRNACARS